MSTDLKRRLEKLEAAQPPAVMLGTWAHRDGGVPIRHDLVSTGFDLGLWFRKGDLPKDVGFTVFPMCEEGLSGNPEYLEVWQPFAELQPDALGLLKKMLIFATELTGFYNFDGLRFRGVHGVLPPNEQIRELMPHG